MDEKLTGRSLDAAVAEKVMGWRRELKAWYRPDGHSAEIFQVPSYSSQIADAMQVVEKMRGDGWSFACTLYEGKLPYASFCKGTAASSRSAKAETLPTAICLASLAAVGESDSELGEEE